MRKNKFQLGSQPIVFAASTGMVHTDYKLIERITAAVAKILIEGNEVHITSDFGTDLTFPIEGSKAEEMTGICRPGSLACFPDGESAMAPVEGTANDTLVIDASIHRRGNT